MYHLSFLSSYIGDAPHICHYCGCWEEDETFYIQLEYSFFGSITKYREKVLLHWLVL